MRSRSSSHWGYGRCRRRRRIQNQYRINSFDRCCCVAEERGNLESVKDVTTGNVASGAAPFMAGVGMVRCGSSSSTPCGDMLICPVFWWLFLVAVFGGGGDRRRPDTATTTFALFP